MSQNRKYHFSKLLIASMWSLLGAAILVVTVAAIGNKKKDHVAGIQIIIKGEQKKLFLDQKEVMQLLEKTSGKNLKNQSIGTLDLTHLENQLQKNPWIQKAELFFDNNNTLQVIIEEAIPVARIYSTDGNSFYISATAQFLPLSDRFSARLPVFTGFPATTSKIKKQDSALAQQIIPVAQFIENDPFWMSQVEQTDITSDGIFVMVPKLGNQIIRFGTAENYQEKFSKLMAFYQQVQTKTGWNKYSVIDLQFDNQVVAVKRDAADIKADSIASIRIMKNIIAEAKSKSADSSQIQLPAIGDAGGTMISNSPSKKDDIKLVIPENKHPEISDNPPILNRDTATKEVTEPVKKESVKKVIKIPQKETKEKKEIKQKEKEIQVPKAVMPSKNDKEEKQDQEY